MSKILLTPNRRALLISTLAWLLAASLLNILGNGIPILFTYQEYFLALCIFSMGLGFFGAGGAADSEATAHPEAADTVSDAAPVSTTDSGSDVCAVLASAGETPALPGPDKDLSPEWIYWTTLIMVILAATTCSAHPVGLSQAIAVVLQAPSTYVDHEGFIKGPLQLELLSIATLVGLAFAFVRVLRPFGTCLSRAGAALSGASLLCTFAGGAALAWSIYLLFILAGIPAQVPLLIVMALSIPFMKAPWGRAIAASAVTIVSAIVIAVYGIVSPTPEESPSDKALHSTRWAAGSRIDTVPVMNGSKLVGVVVNVDRQPYQFFPVADVNADDMHFLHKSYGLPEFLIDYRTLPYLAMPNTGVQKALILSSGLGNHLVHPLAKKIPSIHAVEGQNWLLNLARQIPITPYCNSSVTAINEDPRQYLKGTPERYDLIVYTALSTPTQANPFVIEKPENLLFTTESFADASDHLNPGGHVVVEYSDLNVWARTWNATNLVTIFYDSKHGGDLTADLKSPYTSFLIATKGSKGVQPPELTTPNQELLQLGPKVVKDPAKLRDACKPLSRMPFTDDLPFMLSLARSLPLADMFLINLFMITVLVSIRTSPHSPILSSLNKGTFTTLVLGAICTLSMTKAVMTIIYGMGYTPVVSFTAVIACWLLLTLTAFIHAKVGQEGSMLNKGITYLHGEIGITGGVLWATFFLSFLLDNQFNYEFYPPDVLTRVAMSAILPLLPVLCISLLLGYKIAGEKDTRTHLGFMMFGMSFGCLLQLFATFAGISNLSMLSLVIGVALLISTRQRKPKSKAEPAPVPS